MFRKAADFEAFKRVMAEAHQREPIRILAELWPVGQSMFEGARRRRGDEGNAVALARVPAGERDCSRQRLADRQGTGPSSGEP